MTENVYFLSKNYRVSSPKFRDLLARVRKGMPTKEDAKKIMNLHLHFYDNIDPDFVRSIESDKKTMWLFTNNASKDEKNIKKIVETSKCKKVPIACMDCWYASNKLQDGHKNRAVKSHFDRSTFVDHTDFCVRARVTISRVNFLPEVGLYNGSIGTLKETVYKTSSVGPNDKQHCHLPDYVVVDFPNLNLPPHIKPWDSEHPTVSRYSLCAPFPALLDHLTASLPKMINSMFQSQCTRFHAIGNVAK